MQGPFHAMPNAVRSIEVEGTSKSHTVSSTDTSWVTPPVTCSVPVYSPAGVAGGGRGVGADLLSGGRDPVPGGGCGAGGEQSVDEAEGVDGWASLVGCFPERRRFLVPAGQLRVRAAYCTSGVLVNAQSRAILG